MCTPYFEVPNRPPPPFPHSHRIHKYILAISPSISRVFRTPKPPSPHKTENLSLPPTRFGGHFYIKRRNP